jgi:hypothetical protein
VEYTVGDAMNTNSITTKDLDYFINLLGKAMSGFERIDTSSEIGSIVGKMLSCSISLDREIFHERKS